MPGMPIPSFKPPPFNAFGATQTARGVYRKATPLPTGYVLDERYTTDPYTGERQNIHSREVNPNQMALDTERQRAEEARRNAPPRPATYGNIQQQQGPSGPVSGYGEQPHGPSSGPEPSAERYEDYTDESELQRLIQLARSGFKGTPEERQEDYLDEGLLARFEADAANRYQFQPEEYQDDPKARALSFGRAKDNVGLINRSALDSLREEMAATGRLGSGVEAQLGANIIGGGAQQLSQFETDQAMDEATARRGVSTRNADRKAHRDSQIAAMLPSLASQAHRTRTVPGDPNAVMRQQEQYLAGLMPQLLKQAQKKRRVA